MLCVVRSPLFIALAVLAVLLVALEAARPGFFLHDDNATWFAGAYAQDFRTLTQSGELAQVNFYQYGGEPFLEQGQTGVLYPPVYVAAALATVLTGDLRWTVDWLAAMHLALALIGFYVWLRRGGGAAHGCDPTMAALGGLAWALNPFVLLLGSSWVMVTAAAAWLPWLFWAVDLVLVRASTSPAHGGRGLPLMGRAAPLGVIAGIYVLQGYVQWAAYAFLFAGLYAAYWLFVGGKDCEPADGQEPVPPRVDGGPDLGLRGSTSPAPGGRGLPQKLIALGFAALIAAAVAGPQVLPLLHGAAESRTRAQELSPMFELFYRVELGDLGPAQFGFFREHFLFGASTALFFCPALMLLPVALLAFVRGDEAVRRRLFPLILLAVIALVFSGRAYFLLNVVPFMQKFRWPFKVFLYAEFFLIAGLVEGLARTGARTGRSPSLQADFESPRPPLGQRRLPGALLLGVVVVLEVMVGLEGHSGNLLSEAGLPSSRADLPAGLDPALGRAIAIGDPVPAAEAYRFFSHAYGTYYEVPSLGGYNPLVSKPSLAFALGFDVPNFYDQPITPALQAGLESRAVRYWIVEAHSLDLVEKVGALGGLAGFRLIASDSGRLILEDKNAAPIAFDEAAPAVALPVRYAGNSMFVRLSGAAGTVAVSVGPTEGWWYRVDESVWQQSGYTDFRLRVPVSAGSRELEVRYFDPWLREGLWISLAIICLIIAMTFLGLRLKRKSLQAD